MAKQKVAIFSFRKGQASLGSVSTKTETKISRQNANGGPAFSHYLNAPICGISADY